MRAPATDPAAIAIRRAAAVWRRRRWLRQGLGTAVEAIAVAAVSALVSGWMVGSEAMIVAALAGVTVMVVVGLRRCLTWWSDAVCLTAIDAAMAQSDPAWRHAPLAAAQELLSAPPAGAAPWMMSRCIALAGSAATELAWSRIDPWRGTLAMAWRGAVAVVAMAAVWGLAPAARQTARAPTMASISAPILEQIGWRWCDDQPEPIAGGGATVRIAAGRRIAVDLRFATAVAAVELHRQGAAPATMRGAGSDWTLDLPGSASGAWRITAVTKDARAWTMPIELDVVEIPRDLPRLELFATSHDLRTSIAAEPGLAWISLELSTPDGLDLRWQSATVAAGRMSIAVAPDWSVIGTSAIVTATALRHDGTRLSASAAISPDPEGEALSLLTEVIELLGRSERLAGHCAAAIRAAHRLSASDEVAAQRALIPIQTQWSTLRREATRAQRLLGTAQAGTALATWINGPAEDIQLELDDGRGPQIDDEVAAFARLVAEIRAARFDLSRYRQRSRAGRQVDHWRRAVDAQRAAMAWTGAAWSPGLRLQSSVAPMRRLSSAIDVESVNGAPSVTAIGEWWVGETSVRSLELHGTPMDLAVRINGVAALVRRIDERWIITSQHAIPHGWASLELRWRQAAHVRVRALHRNQSPCITGEFRHRATTEDAALLAAMIEPDLRAVLPHWSDLEALTVADPIAHPAQKNDVTPPRMVLNWIEERAPKSVSWRHAWIDLGATPRRVDPLLAPHIRTDRAYAWIRHAAAMPLAATAPLLARAHAALTTGNADSAAAKAASAYAQALRAHAAIERASRPWTSPIDLHHAEVLAVRPVASPPSLPPSPSVRPSATVPYSIEQRAMIHAWRRAVAGNPP